METIPGQQTSKAGHILVVDDSPTSRTLLKGILEQRGYQVQVAEDGEEALAAVRADPPELILLDLLLPRMDGYKVTRRLRRDPELPYIPIILITTVGDPESKVRGLEAGADDFVVKPPDDAELQARVGALLRLKRSQEAFQLEKCKIDLLYQVSRELSAELDMEALIPRILDLTIEAVAAAGGSLILVDEWSQATHYFSSREGQGVAISESVWQEVMEQGLAGWVVRYGQGVIVSDTEQDPRWIMAEGSFEGTRSALAVALIHADQILGVLTLTQTETGHFTPDHLELSTSIASQAAVAIEKARSYLKEQAWARKLQLVNEVGRRATSILDPDRLLREITRLIGRSFDYYYVSTDLLVEDKLVNEGWDFGRGGEIELPPIQLPIAGKGIKPWVARRGQPLLATDVRLDSRFLPIEQLPDTVSEAAVPLQAGGETLGVLDVQSDRLGQLTKEDLPLLETLASQIAVALRNAQLFARTQQKLQQQRAMLEETGMPTEASLRGIARTLIELLGKETVAKRLEVETTEMPQLVEELLKRAKSGVGID
jgi:DNA-binding response OmpR family regulator/putative methionine-R-sulfoxide reductase with GAF domain